MSCIMRRTFPLTLFFATCATAFAFAPADAAPNAAEGVLPLSLKRAVEIIEYVLDQILEMEGLHIKLLDPRKLPSILPAVCEKQ